MKDQMRVKVRVESGMVTTTVGEAHYLQLPFRVQLTLTLEEGREELVQVHVNGQGEIEVVRP